MRRRAGTHAAMWTPDQQRTTPLIAARCAASGERRSRSAGLSPVDPDDAAFFDREGQPAVLQRYRGFAEQFAAPAVQSGDVCLIVGGDLVEIVDGGNDLAGDGVAFRRHPQQHLEKFDGCRAIGVAARLFDLRQRVGITGEAALHGGDDIGAPFGAVKALGQRAQAGEALQRGR